MKKHTIIRMIAAAAMGLLCCTGCAAQSGGSTAESGSRAPAASSVPAEKKLVIIDTDTGADDASALILAAKSERLEILGVTVLLGNVGLQQSADNALMALETAGCDAPVYLGADTTYTGEKKEAFSVFGKDGMGDADLIHPTRKPESGDAVDFIIDTVKAHPGEVEIIALGPATNIAKAIDKDLNTMKQVKRIWSMGSAGLGPGNATPVAEFNVFADAPAYQAMLSSGLPVTILGLDMCDGAAMWTDANFDTLSKSGAVGKFVTDSFGKLREFYRSNGYEGTVMNCDSVMMMCVAQDDFIEGTANCHASCVTDSSEAYAQVIFYREGFTYDAAGTDHMQFNDVLITGVAKSSYFDRYLKAVS